MARARLRCTRGAGRRSAPRRGRLGRSQPRRDHESALRDQLSQPRPPALRRYLPVHSRHPGRRSVTSSSRSSCAPSAGPWPTWATRSSGCFDWTWALAYLPVAALMWISFSGGHADRRIVGRRASPHRRHPPRHTLCPHRRGAGRVLVRPHRIHAADPPGLPGRRHGDGQRRAVGAAFCASAAFLLVGAPAWWGHWWSQQIRVRSEAYEAGGPAVPSAPRSSAASTSPASCWWVWSSSSPRADLPRSWH